MSTTPTAWVTETLSPRNYIGGIAPVRRWPGGEFNAALPDRTIIEVTISSGMASGLELFVWNRLHPESVVRGNSHRHPLPPAG